MINIKVIAMRGYSTDFFDCLEKHEVYITDITNKHELMLFPEKEQLIIDGNYIFFIKDMSKDSIKKRLKGKVKSSEIYTMLISDKRAGKFEKENFDFNIYKGFNMESQAKKFVKRLFNV